MKMNKELDDFIRHWQQSADQNSALFCTFKKRLEAMEGVTLTFIARPGVTHSLRATHAAQQDRPLFVMIDVIEDSPRWLSVCFYGEMIHDPEVRGDVVPQGLLGEDAICFDIETYNDELVHYVAQRIEEAYTKASQCAGFRTE